jgi:PilZ domain
MSSDVKELRFTLRFVATSPLTGSFGTASIAIIDIGETGAQVEHPQPLRLATKGRLSFRGGADTFASYGVVVWSHLSKTPNEKGKLLYRSGVRFEDDSIDFAKLIDALLAHGIIKPDDDSLERKRQRLAQREAERASKRSVLRSVQHIDISADQILLIQHARDRLRTHPDEAMKWYNRAKYSIAQNQGNAQEMLYHREEVLAVWEYLERTVDIQIIARVFDMKKAGEGPPA